LFSFNHVKYKTLERLWNNMNLTDWSNVTET
jgi:hypothetical protein